MQKRQSSGALRGLSDVAHHSVLTSLRQAFQVLLPVFMVGAFSLSMMDFPVAAVRNFIGTALGGSIRAALELVYNATYGMAAVYLTLVLSHFESLRQRELKEIRMYAVVCAGICFFAFMGPDVYSGKVSLLQYTKMSNIFSAALVAVGSTALFFCLYRWINRRHLRERIGSFERSLQGIVPLTLCVLTAAGLSLCIRRIPGVYNFSDLIARLIELPFESMGASFFSGVLAMLCISVLWLLGIHGSNVFDSLLTNASGPFAVAAGHIVTKPFIDTYVWMGGCGTSLCLLLALVLFGRSRRNRRLSRLSALPVLFNINETLIYGLPIVLNPLYAVPFVATPLVSYGVAYAATALELVPTIVRTDVQWTTPPILSGYLATGSAAGSLLQLVLLALGVAIYAPFVRLAERAERERTTRNIRWLTKICRDCEEQNRGFDRTQETLEMHILEDSIASRLDQTIRRGELTLYYQPQMKEERIVAAEALLRFRMDASAENDWVYPPLVVAIATRYGLFDRMSRAVVQRALADLSEMQRICGRSQLHMAVNLRLDLLLRPEFRQWLVETVEQAPITPHTFGVEITEDAHLTDGDSCSELFAQLKQAGIDVLMDDFSMGHTSVTILQKNYFDYVKIDGGLIRQLDNERCRSIVSSIVQLGKQLHFSVLAEFVETEAQRDTLLEMGCNAFQGYLYYKAMPPEELRAVLLRENESHPAPADRQEPVADTECRTAPDGK
mgnify:CR=1 FL=1